MQKKDILSIFWQWRKRFYSVAMLLEEKQSMTGLSSHNIHTEENHFSSVSANHKFLTMSCSFSLAQHVKRRHKTDQVNKKGFILWSYKDKTECSSLPKRHFIVIVSIQNISPAPLADLHFKTIVRTYCREKQLKSRVRVCLSKKKNAPCNCTLLSGGWTREELIQEKKISLILLALSSSAVKESDLNNC